MPQLPLCEVAWAEHLCARTRQVDGNHRPRDGILADRAMQRHAREAKCSGYDTLKRVEASAP
eukprot:scaffold10284_cov118-Isochrysis_galbana.AAC.6